MMMPSGEAINRIVPFSRETVQTFRRCFLARSSKSLLRFERIASGMIQVEVVVEQTQEWKDREEQA